MNVRIRLVSIKCYAGIENAIFLAADMWHILHNPNALMANLNAGFDSPCPVLAGGGGEWSLPYMGYIGMCGLKGYDFAAVLVINWVSILAIVLPFWS